MAEEQELLKTTLKLPPPDAGKKDLEAFRDRWFRYENVVRNRRLERAALNLQYYLGNQWIYLDTQVVGPSGNGYSFRSIQPRVEEFPKPVTNVCLAAVETELAANARRKLTPQVIPTSPDPGIKTAAKQAQKILEYNLEQSDWPGVRNTFDLHCLLFPNAILWEYWEESFLDQLKVSNPEAMRCPGCGNKFSSKLISPEDLVSKDIKHQEMMSKVEDSDSMEIGCCPCCEQEQSLEPYGDMGEEDLNQEDYFNRPMGLTIPKGKPVIEVPTVFDYFPENSGIGVTPRNLRVHGFAMVRPLEWIEEHYPEAGDVDPEEPYELSRWHPTINAWDILGNHSTHDSGVYDHHARVYTLIAEKSMQYPDGQVWIWIKDKFIKSYPLYRVVNGKKAPVHSVQVTRWKEIPGELWGKSIVDDLISPQNRINAIDSQFVEARERMGAPNLLSPGPLYLDTPEWGRDYGIGRILRFEPNPLAPNAAPVPFGGTLFPIEAYQERQQCLRDIQDIAGPKGIEAGDPPKNISTTGGLQLVGEQADRRRAPREQERLQAFTRIWESILTQLSVFRTELEQDYYEVIDEDGTYSRKQFDSNTIQGQIKVKIDAQSEVGKSLYQREAVREAQADGLLRLDSQVAIKRMLELRGLPTDINQDLNYQVDRANQQWVDFRDDGVVPVVDLTVDDPAIRYQVLAEKLLSEEGTELSQLAGWSGMIPTLAGWEEELQKLEMMDQQVRAFYQTTNPDQASQLYLKATEGYNRQKEAFEKQSAANFLQAQATGQVTPDPPPPQLPAPPIFVPKYLPARIQLVWKQMLGNTDQGAQPQEGIASSFMAFMSVVSAYKILAQQVQASPAPPAGPTQ